MATSRKQQQDFPVSGFLPEPRRPIVILRPIHDDEVDGIDDDVASPARDLQDAVQKFVSEGREEKDGADRWTQRRRLVGRHHRRTRRRHHPAGLIHLTLPCLRGLARLASSRPK